MNIVDRLKSYMDYIGMASTQFADVANIPRPTISQILNGRNRKISNEVIEKLHAGFPNLNIMWLLFGDGEMEMRSNTKRSDTATSVNSFNIPPQPSNNMQFSAQSLQNSQLNTPIQSSSIDEFVNDTIHTRRPTDGNPAVTPSAQPPASSTASVEKKIRYIMVFFNDNSFEVLTPGN